MLKKIIALYITRFSYNAYVLTPTPIHTHCKKSVLIASTNVIGSQCAKTYLTNLTTFLLFNRCTSYFEPMCDMTRRTIGHIAISNRINMFLKIGKTVKERAMSLPDIRHP